ncbi:hypothetical protein MZM54_00620 [[Brevibacterium] frigoritolerans]|nr:hypothetical protein [Peribacillus frigoritolerans]
MGIRDNATVATLETREKATGTILRIRDNATGRTFVQDGDWKAFTRDWNNDGQKYEMTVGFFEAEQPNEKLMNRIELMPSDVGPFARYTQIW